MTYLHALVISLFFVTAPIRPAQTAHSRLPNGAESVADSAASFADACRLLFDGTHPPLTTDRTEQLVLGTYCAAYVKGFLEALFHSAPKALACLPASLTTPQAIGVFIRFVDSHPDKANLAVTYVLPLALTTAFPCRP